MSRDASLDATKYILIMLVVIGHFIEPSKYTNDITTHLYSLIYSFHMPLFVWISGYFYKQRLIKEEIRKSLRLIEVCLVAHVGFTLIKNGGYIHLLDLFTIGNSPAWYLGGLIFWRLCTDFFLAYLSKWKLLLGSMLLAFILFFCMRHTALLAYGRTLMFYPFFVLGYCMKNSFKHIIERYKALILVSGGVYALYIIDSQCIAISNRV